MILSKFKQRIGLGTAIGLGSLLMASGSALAQTEVVVIKRPAELRDAPGDAARALTALPVQTPVTRLGDRQGPWIKVRMADGAQGWVHMFDVSSASALAGAGTGNAGTSALRSISSFFNKGSTQAQGGTVATSTLGIRGLGAENLASAQPNVAAVAQADALRQDTAQARQFASASALASRSVEPLPVPAAPTASNTGAAAPLAPDR
jgi:hypothetical protein